MNNVSENISVKIHLPEKRDIWVPCGDCGKDTCHQILCGVATYDQNSENGIFIEENFYIIQCGGCRTVSFCIKSVCSEDIDYGLPADKMYKAAEVTRVYPNRMADRSEIEYSYFLPDKIYKIYKETLLAVCNNQPTLAGIGIRAIVETVCKDKAVKGDNLEKRIDGLATKGIVTEDGAKILHNLRFMGNKAAHEVKAHKQNELITALEVVEYTLKGVYILPLLAEKLPKENVNPH